MLRAPAVRGRYERNDLCDRCQSIDLHQFFAIDSRTLDEHGFPLVDLDSIPESIKSSTCTFCALIASMVHSPNRRPYSEVGKAAQGRWHLRAFSSLSQLSLPYTEHWQSKRPPTVVSLVEGSMKHDPEDLGAPWFSPTLLPCLESCSDEDTTSAFHFHRIPIKENEISYSILRSYIRTCSSEHDQCRWLHKGYYFAFAPRRLISCKSRLIVQNDTFTYATLSYVWGPQQAALLGDWNCSSGKLPDKLPKTTEDAMHATLHLGLEYLWVDRCCIDQFDPKDVRVHIAGMAAIFAGSEVTLIALGEDSDAGLPGVSVPRFFPSPVQVGNSVAGPLLPDLEHHVTKSKWSTRGWTFQELFLSQRCLVFTECEVFFLCSQEIRSESLCQKSDDFRPSKRFLRDSILRASILQKRWLAPTQLKGEVFDPEFVVKLHEYSRRQLTFEEDALDAFRGILSTLDVPSYWAIAAWECADPENALSSVFESGFLYGLMWYCCSSSINKQQLRRRPGFPSWSWPSIPCAVNCWSSQMMFQAQILKFTAVIWMEDENGSKERLERVFERYATGKNSTSPRPLRDHNMIPEKSRYLHLHTYTTAWMPEGSKFSEGVLKRVPNQPKDNTIMYDPSAFKSYGNDEPDMELRDLEYEAVMLLAYEDCVRWLLVEWIDGVAYRVGFLESRHGGMGFSKYSRKVERKMVVLG